MPKAPSSSPLSALFAINKPTGVTSMSLLNNLQPLLQSSSLFAKQTPASHPNDKSRRRKSKQDRIKIGQGGTLDPLADGVLVVGVNNATKQLASFLDCTKEYRAIGLVGTSTDSYDSEGKVVKRAGFEGVTRQSIEEALGQFRGEIDQVPPVYSALKMDGMPLYEYARKGLPLPRPIAARKQVVHELELLSFTPGEEHTYEPPAESLPEEQLKELVAIQKMVEQGGTVVPTIEEPTPLTDAPAPTVRPPIFELRMVVSSGTYVRSIIHDLGLALGSAAHVVKLTRTRQGAFVLNPDDVSSVLAIPSPTEQAPAPASAPTGIADDASPAEVPTPAPAADAADAATPAPAPVAAEPTAQAAAAPTPAPPILETFAGGCIEWSLLKDAIAELEQSKKEGKEPERDADGWLPWEVELLRRCKEV